MPAHPALRGAVTTEVVVVGGGLTGCAVAYAFAAAGVKVAVVEAARIAQGASAANPGVLAEVPAGGFQELVRSAGVRHARHAWQAWRRAALDFAALLRRLDVRCGLEAATGLLVARTPEQAAWVARELKARREAGLEVTRPTAQAVRADAALDAVAALRTRDGATLDPYRAALGLARAALDRGAAIFERSAVKAIHPGPRTVEVTTAGGRVTARRVIVATGQPTPLFRSLVRHVRAQRVYCAVTEPLPAALRRTLGSATVVTTDRAVPPHRVRWIEGERLLVAGADGPAVPERLRARTLVQRTGQLMYELSTVYPDISGVAPSHGWDAGYGQTPDALPYIGPHRNFPRHLFAFGGSAHAITDAYLASRILLRCHLEEADAADEVFGFARGQAIIG